KMNSQKKQMRLCTSSYTLYEHQESWSRMINFGFYGADCCCKLANYKQQNAEDMCKHTCMFSIDFDQNKRAAQQHKQTDQQFQDSRNLLPGKRTRADSRAAQRTP